VEPLGLDVEGLQVGVGERPVGEVRGLDVEAGHVEARGGGDERVDRRLQPEVDRIEARRFRVGMLEGAAHRLGAQVHVRVDAAGAAPDDAEVEAGEAVVPEDLVFRLAAGHAQSVPKMRVKAMIVSWTLLAAALIGRGPLTSSGLGVDMGWSGRSL